MNPRLPRIAPGDILTAEHINAPNEALERLGLRVGIGTGLGKREGPGGTSLYLAETPDIWAKITSGGGGTGGSSGPYAWTEQIPDYSTGTTPNWVNGSLSGTTTANPAFESTGNTAVATGKIVRLRYSEASRVWIFTYGACS